MLHTTGQNILGFEIMKIIHIIGGGLAGCEAAWQLSRRNVECILYEMRPQIMTEAHTTSNLAELVCSNSFRSDDSTANAVGVLHEEMRQCDSLIMKAADTARIPAGSALAVDRDLFSENVEKAITDEKLINLQRTEMTLSQLSPDAKVIIATGPLTSSRLSDEIAKLSGKESLAFFDAIAPVVYTDSIDFSKAWYQSRYDKNTELNGSGDYINCPLNKKEYNDFIDDLTSQETIKFKSWEEETPYFEGCMPIEEMARRGRETLRFGPMKPVGLTNPHTGERPHAVVQLRQDNEAASLYNMVGFQTKTRHSNQKQLFRRIPGLENAEFAKLGGLHRNTFINSPRLLDKTLRFKRHERIRFAGQITGVEGYLESAAMGLLAGTFFSNETLGSEPNIPPENTALASLLSHITNDEHGENFQPTNINFGLFPELPSKINHKSKAIRLKGVERKKALAERALNDLNGWINCTQSL